MEPRASAASDRVVYTAAMLAASLGFLVNLYLFIYVRLSAPDILRLPLVGMGAIPSTAEVLADFAAHGPQHIRIASIDTVFTVCYLVFFVGLYALARTNAPLLARLGLGAVILTAVFDASENLLTVFFGYNAYRGLGYDVSSALLPYYLLTGLKWISAAAALASFVSALPRSSWLERGVVVVGLVFAAASVLGLAWPSLGPVKGALLWASMPLFAVLFWRCRHKPPVLAA